MSTSVLRADNISHTYKDELDALKDVSFELRPKTFTCLIGPSGCGKSTLMRILAGLLRPSQGSVFLNNIPLQKTRQEIGIVFQDANLMPWRNVRKNLVLPLEVLGINRQEQSERAEHWLKLLDLERFAEKYPSALSGGMAQRLAIGRALIANPDILLMDEPFGALDALTREKMGEELLRIWAETQKTALMITHSLQEAILLADDVLVMSNRPGMIIERFKINLPRPRRLAMITHPKFVALHANIRDAMRL